jgi:hypothetical protein
VKTYTRFVVVALLSQTFFALSGFANENPILRHERTSQHGIGIMMNGALKGGVTSGGGGSDSTSTERCIELIVKSAGTLSSPMDLEGCGLKAAEAYCAAVMLNHGRTIEEASKCAGNSSYYLQFEL